MKFEENLRELRKQKGFSQEELASQLNVSRQAVSKWENGSGYPELDKLLLLCEIFHCTMDDVLKGDVREHNGVRKERYDQHYTNMAKAYSLATFLLVSAVTAGAVLDGILEKRQEYIMGIVFFSLITLGVILFIYFGYEDSAFQKKYPSVSKHLYSEEEHEQFEKKFRIALIVGIAIIFFDLMLSMYLEPLIKEYILGGVFMFLISIAVSIFVYMGIQKGKFDRIFNEQDEEREETMLREKKVGKWCGIIMILATMVFFVLGMGFHGWKLSWLSFVVGGLCCGIVSIIYEK